MNNEYFLSLDKGEQELVEWQFRLNQGSFKSALWNAIKNADDINLARLFLGFPSQIEAYRKYTGIKGWWLEIRKGLEI